MVTEYLDRQERLPSEVRTCFIEDGMKVVYSDEEPLPETSIRLEEIHREIEAGAPLVEHAVLLINLRLCFGLP